jgi:spermidine/putrescine-binding protein
MRLITKKHLPRRTFLRGLGAAATITAALTPESNRPFNLSWRALNFYSASGRIQAIFRCWNNK